MSVGVEGVPRSSFKVTSYVICVDIPCLLNQGSNYSQLRERAVQKSHSIVVIIFRDETHHRRICLTILLTRENQISFFLVADDGATLIDVAAPSHYKVNRSTLLLLMTTGQLVGNSTPITRNEALSL